MGFTFHALTSTGALILTVQMRSPENCDRLSPFNTPCAIKSALIMLGKENDEKSPFKQSIEREKFCVSRFIFPEALRQVLFHHPSKSLRFKIFSLRSN